MSDSDEDIMAETVHRLRRHNIMNSAATNMNNTIITNVSYRHNSVTSTLRPNNIRQINGLQTTNQEHNMYYRRETSPMSLKSLRDSRPQSFRNYPGSIRSHTSVYDMNDRGGSPMSMRSIDSNVSAMDIAQAFKNGKFNKYDLRLIREAYNKLMKNQTRKRIAKKKNLKLYLKGHRRKPEDDDSGEHGSDSSMSSDDCRSTRTFHNSKRSGPSYTNMDKSHFGTSIRDCNMNRDRTETSRQQTRLQNVFTHTNNSVTHDKNDTIIHQNRKCNSIIQKTSQKNIFNTTLKERLTKSTNSFLLPSQRFKKSDVDANDTETFINQRKDIQNGNKNNKINQQNIDSDSEEEDILSEITIRENPQHGLQKRFLDDSEAVCPENKRYKPTSLIKQSNVTNLTQNDFHFKQPQRPARKSASNKKESVPEMIIAMSKPLPDSIQLDLPKKASDNLDQTHSRIPVNSTEIDESPNQTKISQNTSDVSMRPSFIKRKLFTQKLDVAENKNLSSDNVGTNSPQTKLYSGVRNKNKVRKLVTSQTCLSRDVLCDNNVLDLIQKIVPPDQINVTTASNKREINKTNDNDKWDVTSVISTCDNGDVSDTFTDEEIFKVSSNLHKRPKLVQQAVEDVTNPDLLKNNKSNIVTPCKVTVQKLPIAKSKEDQREIEDNQSNCSNKKLITNCVKSFWDTDFESDMEVTPFKSRKSVVGEEFEKSTVRNNTRMNDVNTKTRETNRNIKSLRNKTINSSMKSDIRKVLKKTNIQESKNNNIIAKNLETNKESQTNTNLSEDTKKKLCKPMQKDSEKENIKAKSVQTKIKATKKENICNTSRESLRLKEKNEKKRHTVGDAQICKENDDPIKLNKLTSRNNKGSNKNNNNNDMKNNNNMTMTSSLKKNNTIKQTPKKQQQTRNLFDTSASDSSFNISNRSLRVRQNKVIYSS